MQCTNINNLCSPQIYSNQLPLEEKLPVITETLEQLIKNHRAFTPNAFYDQMCTHVSNWNHVASSLNNTPIVYNCAFRFAFLNTKGIPSDYQRGMEKFHEIRDLDAPSTLESVETFVNAAEKADLSLSVMKLCDQAIEDFLLEQVPDPFAKTAPLHPDYVRHTFKDREDLLERILQLPLKNSSARLILLKPYDIKNLAKVVKEEFSVEEGSVLYRILNALPNNNSKELSIHCDEMLLNSTRWKERHNQSKNFAETEILLRLALVIPKLKNVLHKSENYQLFLLKLRGDGPDEAYQRLFYQKNQQAGQERRLAKSGIPLGSRNASPPNKRIKLATPPLFENFLLGPTWLLYTNNKPIELIELALALYRFSIPHNFREFKATFNQALRQHELNFTQIANLKWSQYPLLIPLVMEEAIQKWPHLSFDERKNKITLNTGPIDLELMVFLSSIESLELSFTDRKTLLKALEFSQLTGSKLTSLCCSQISSLWSDDIMVTFDLSNRGFYIAINNEEIKDTEDLLKLLPDLGYLNHLFIEERGFGTTPTLGNIESLISYADSIKNSSEITKALVEWKLKEYLDEITDKSLGKPDFTGPSRNIELSDGLNFVLFLIDRRDLADRAANLNLPKVSKSLSCMIDKLNDYKKRIQSYQRSHPEIFFDGQTCILTINADVIDKELADKLHAIHRMPILISNKEVLAQLIQDCCSKGLKIPFNYMSLLNHFLGDSLDIKVNSVNYSIDISTSGFDQNLEDWPLATGFENYFLRTLNIDDSSFDDITSLNNIRWLIDKAETLPEKALFIRALINWKLKDYLVSMNNSSCITSVSEDLLTFMVYENNLRKRALKLNMPDVKQAIFQLDDLIEGYRSHLMDLCDLHPYLFFNKDNWTITVSCEKLDAEAIKELQNLGSVQLRFANRKVLVNALRYCVNSNLSIPFTLWDEINRLWDGVLKVDYENSHFNIAAQTTTHHVHTLQLLALLQEIGKLAFLEIDNHKFDSFCDVNSINRILDTFNDNAFVELPHLAFLADWKLKEDLESLEQSSDKLNGEIFSQLWNYKRDIRDQILKGNFPKSKEFLTNIAYTAEERMREYIEAYLDSSSFAEYSEVLYESTIPEDSDFDRIGFLIYLATVALDNPKAAEKARQVLDQMYDDWMINNKNADLLIVAELYKCSPFLQEIIDKDSLTFEWFENGVLQSISLPRTLTVLRSQAVRNFLRGDPDTMDCISPSTIRITSQWLKDGDFNHLNSQTPEAVRSFIRNLLRFKIFSYCCNIKSLKLFLPNQKGISVEDFIKHKWEVNESKRIIRYAASNCLE